MDLFSQYLNYNKGNEATVFFHRWSLIVCVGALLSRNYYIQHGNFNIYPNMYAVLLGVPGTRKSTAIKIAKGILSTTGYNTYAAERTTKEKFLMDLAGEDLETSERFSSLEQSLWGGREEFSSLPKEMFICADEMYDFMGTGNIEFISMLGSLWDFNGKYENKVKNSKSVSINDPTISILGGATPTTFSLAFPPEILGQGFFSRLILVHGEPSGKRITFPEVPTPESKQALTDALNNIKRNCVGQAVLSPEAITTLDFIYKSWKEIDDARFESYSNRRFTHLLKLCLIHNACRQIQDPTRVTEGSKQISEQDVIYANTVLSHTELLMPRALGEFGRAKNSDVKNKVLEHVRKVATGTQMKDILKSISSDINNPKELQDIISSLVMADKIQFAPQAGYIPKYKPYQEGFEKAVDYSFLTDEERKVHK